MVTDIILELGTVKRVDGSSCDVAGGMRQCRRNAGVDGAFKLNIILFTDNLQRVFGWAFRYSTLFYSYTREFLT